MRKFTRLPAPDFLAPRWEQWGRDWEGRQKAGGKFHWHEVDREPVNQKLLPALKAQTQDHCSFCDNYPVSPPSVDTIEHFRPKSRFPREAYQWENLYFCCVHCQQKGEEFDEAMLRPDAEDFAFERYFRRDYTQGLLLVNELAPPEDQHRAEVTIRLYRLNQDHPRSRRLALRARGNDQASPLNDFAYRDFLGPTW
jgi:uncharacterized protein (TIGR02646 family)